MAHLKSGKIKPIFVANAERLAVLPDIPTAREAGFPQFEVGSTYAILAPAGTPAPVLQRLNQEIHKAMAQPEIRGRMQQLGVEVRVSSLQDSAAALGSELTRWSKAIKDANVKLD
jgi:tripartite-type tricarboxylate transporter receptor subunit TctC